MDIMGIIFLCLFGLIFLGLFIYQFNKNKREKAQNKKQINEYAIKLELLSSENKNLIRNYDMMTVEANLTAEDKNKLESELKLLQKEFFQLKESIQVDAVKNDQKELLEAQIAELNKLIDAKNIELSNLTELAGKISEDESEKISRIAELEKSMKALEGRIVSGKEVLERLNDEIKVTEFTLADLTNLKASILAVEEGTGVSWVFGSGDKSRLVELIHQLVDEYGNQFPILRKELLKAEWSSV